MTTVTSSIDSRTYYSSSGFTNNITLNNTDYYGNVINGNFVSFTNAAISSFTNYNNILAAGGEGGYRGGNPRDGGSAIFNSHIGTITIKNYGKLLGGGGGGSSYDYNFGNGNTNNIAGNGGTGGGGGGGSGYITFGGNGGSSLNGSGYLVNGSNAQSGTTFTGGGGGGGIGGNGGAGGASTNFPASSGYGVTSSASLFVAGGGGGGGGVSTGGGQGGNASGSNGNYLSGGGGYGGGNGGFSYWNRTGVSTPEVNSVMGGGGGGGGGIGGGYGTFKGGNGGYSIYNTGTIANLYNSQGGQNRYGPLFYGGTSLPQKYYIRLNSLSNEVYKQYGQLYCTGWAAITSGTFNNIDIDPDSPYNTIGTTNFPNVLVGNCFSVCSGITVLNSIYKTTWSIIQTTDVTVGRATAYRSYNLSVTISVTGQIITDSIYLSGYLSNYSVTNPNFSSPLVSAYANYSIASGVGFAVNSDERIKKNIQYLSSVDSFELVKKLKPASFQYIDSMKGTIPKYGYLAQEVESVLPNVVNRYQAYIANFFEMVVVDGNRNKIVLNEKTTESLAIGTKVQFYDADNMIHIREVVEIMDEKTFIINEPFIEDVDAIFLYGQEVEDYRSIDTDQIKVVMLSAFQEIQKRLEKQEKEIDELQGI